MALDPAAFLVPSGLLRASQFPDDDLAGDLLPVWITDAEERATEAGLSTEGQAARAWVYHRAFATRCASGAGAVKRMEVEGKGSMEYDPAATPNDCALAGEWLARAGVLATVYDEAEAVPVESFSVIRSLR
ncbi:MAG TPA: hypothetical protein VD838_12645 [Anaeromyxobacteraceae bacterium]|nr:hypothetical protein [Anaeromyxobacteraceae bacterium]